MALGTSRSCVKRCSRSCRTREVVVSQRRASHDVAEQRQRPVGEPREYGETEGHGVGADVGLELGAEAGNRLMYLDRGQRSRAFVEHVGRDRREAVQAGRIGGGARGHEQGERHDRHLPMADGPHAQTVRQG
jgi:hypothetical protein